MTQAIEKTTERDSQGNIKEEATLFRSTEPQTENILHDVSQSFTSIVQIALNVLINPDVAYRADRTQQEQMMHDPVVMGSLQKRMLATAKLKFEVTPEDPEAPEQVETASKIEAIIKRMPRWAEFVRQLGFAVLRGTSAAEISWELNPFLRTWDVVNHRPFHGDKITYDIYGNPRILTRQYQTGGRELDKGEMDRLIIHTHDREDGEFYDGAQAGYVFKGRGLRDVIWPYWFLKQNALRLWVILLERYGTGFLAGRYPLGNKQAKDAIESVLENLVSGSKVSIPVPGGADKDNYGIFPIEMPNLTASAQMFTDFCENYCGKHIRICIEGQEQAHQDSGDGIGSGRAEKLADIFTMYRDYDANLMQDTLTEQLVGKIQWFNFGKLTYKCGFQFILDSKDYEAQAEKVRAAKEMGLKVIKSWVYESLDAPIPNGDESPDELIDFGGGGMEDLAAMNGTLANGRLFQTNATSGRLFQTDATDIASHAPTNNRPLFRGLMDTPLFDGPMDYSDFVEGDHPRAIDGEFTDKRRAGESLENHRKRLSDHIYRNPKTEHLADQLKKHAESLGLNVYLKRADTGTYYLSVWKETESGPWPETKLRVADHGSGMALMPQDIPLTTTQHPEQLKRNIELAKQKIREISEK